jgi:biuret amidohydrolase
VVVAERGGALHPLVGELAHLLDVVGSEPRGRMHSSPGSVSVSPVGLAVDPDRSSMERAYGLEVPRTLEEVCDPRRLALLVYDMQVGIVQHVPNPRTTIARVSEVLAAAQETGVRTFFSRHMSLPKELMGVSQLRTAMAWERVDHVADVRSLFLRDSPGFQLVPELQPMPDEAVFDKLGMSFFAGTPLDMALRDCGIVAFAIVGLVLEIGIEPTVSHGADLGYVPIVIADACGSVEQDARQRALASIDYSLFSHITDVDTFCRLLRNVSRTPGMARRQHPLDEEVVLQDHCLAGLGAQRLQDWTQARPQLVPVVTAPAAARSPPCRRYPSRLRGGGWPSRSQGPSPSHGPQT